MGGWRGSFNMLKNERSYTYPYIEGRKEGRLNCFKSLCVSLIIIEATFDIRIESNM